jgi:hypothetical protein
MFVLTSYVHCAATFGDISRAFRSALSSVVSLYSAASIDPSVIRAICNGKLACVLAFSKALFLSSHVQVNQIRERNLFEFPAVRQDRIRRYIVDECLQLSGTCVQEPHVEGQHSSHLTFVARRHRGHMVPAPPRLSLQNAQDPSAQPAALSISTSSITTTRSWHEPKRLYASSVSCAINISRITHAYPRS